MAKLTTVIASVNNNPDYYMFIPKQILFWKCLGINFLAVFVGENIPDDLIKYKENIVLWSNNLNLNSVYVSQNLRIYYTALIDLPEDEFVMITDMDMLATNIDYYTTDLHNYNINDFLYYRHIDGNQIYMCYNAANPRTWARIFDIHSENDIIMKINENYNMKCDGIPGSTGWFIDQEVMYKQLIGYSNLKVLNRPLKRLEVYDYYQHLKKNDTNFIFQYDDVHFHRSFFNNESIILDAEKQMIFHFQKPIKLIVLIIASDYPNHYIEMQNIWKKYMNSNTNIKSYFLKSKIDIQDNIVINENENTIYVKNSESLIPGIFHKTIESIKYFLNLSDSHFDYIYRTNLSSLLNLDKMHYFIHNNKVNYGGFIGYHNDIEFASGSGFFLSRDACEYLIKNSIDINIEIPDDVLIGYIMNKKYQIDFINRNDITNEDNKIPMDSNTIFHYRCKSNNEHASTVKIMDKIYNSIYL